MAFKSKVIDKDKGWEELKRTIPELKGAHVKVGLPAKVGRKRKTLPPEFKSRKKKPTLAEVGWWNEFGTKSKHGKVHVPERSFIRSTHDENRRKLLLIKVRLAGKLIDREMKPKAALDFLGQWMQAKIQAKITNLRRPPNAPATIKRKRSSNPLVATRQMVQSITYVKFMPKRSKLPLARRGRRARFE